jgi:hypothetical protein
MSDVGQAISRAVAEIPTPTADPEHVRQTVRRRRARRRITAGGLAILVATAGFALAVYALGPTSLFRTADPGESPEPSPAAKDRGDGVHRVGPEVVVAKGMASGEPWALIAYESDKGLCVEMQVAGGRGGGCGFDVPRRSDLGLSVGSQAGISGSFIHGVVSKRVAILTLTLGGGERLRPEIVDGPEGFDVNFFVLFLPSTSEGVIEARDDQGVVLDTERLRSLSELREQEFLTEEVLDEQKIVVYYPHGWKRAADSLTAATGSSRELVSLGTARLDRGQSDCLGIPARAIENLGPADAFITLQESAPSTVYPDRPENFRAGDGEIPEAAGCFANVEDPLLLMFRFQDGGRSFVAYVAIGDAASAGTRREVWQILDSLIVCDPSSPPGDCL